MLIRKYEKDDEEQLFNLMKKEGEEWKDYWCESGKGEYIETIEKSTLTLVLIEDDLICGFIRCIGYFTIYVDDLLVDKQYRGKNYGKYLLESVIDEFPNKEIYVMSDVDGYYESLGYEKAGSIFLVQKG